MHGGGRERVIDDVEIVAAESIDRVILAHGDRIITEITLDVIGKGIPGERGARACVDKIFDSCRERVGSEIKRKARVDRIDTAAFDGRVFYNGISAVVNDIRIVSQTADHGCDPSAADQRIIAIATNQRIGSCWIAAESRIQFSVFAEHRHRAALKASVYQNNRPVGQNTEVHSAFSWLGGQNAIHAEACVKFAIGRQAHYDRRLAILGRLLDARGKKFAIGKRRDLKPAEIVGFAFLQCGDCEVATISKRCVERAISVETDQHGIHSIDLTALQNDLRSLNQRERRWILRKVCNSVVFQRNRNGFDGGFPVFRVDAETRSRRIGERFKYATIRQNSEVSSTHFR